MTTRATNHLRPAVMQVAAVVMLTVVGEDRSWHLQTQPAEHGGGYCEAERAPGVHKHLVTTSSPGKNLKNNHQALTVSQILSYFVLFYSLNCKRWLLFSPIL